MSFWDKLKRFFGGGDDDLDVKVREVALGFVDAGEQFSATGVASRAVGIAEPSLRKEAEARLHALFERGGLPGYTRTAIVGMWLYHPEGLVVDAATIVGAAFGGTGAPTSSTSTPSSGGWKPPKERASTDPYDTSGTLTLTPEQLRERAKKIVPWRTAWIGRVDVIPPASDERTALIDRERGRATYGVGGGLVWDSEAGGEYRECLLKARVLTERRPAFRLLESLLWEPENGYFLLAAHLARLADTAVYFGVPLDRSATEAGLAERASSLNEASKIRLLVELDGAFVIEATPLAREASSRPVRVGLAEAPVNSSAIWLYHKTTRRELYDAARASRPDCEEVILWNERGELTEASTANVVLDMDGEWLTPPVTSGLLAGTFRNWLLASGQIREQILTLADLRAARRIALINSVRKWREAVLVA